MSFPVSPTNGQTAIVNGIEYVYDIVINSWTIVPFAISVGSDTANAAFIQANSAFDHANSAFDSANNALDTWVRGQANAAFTQANAAFDIANTPSYVANSAAIYANGAFAAANNEAGVNVTQNTNIVLSFNQANSSFGAANIADSKAVTAGLYANSAFNFANGVSIFANTPSHVANSSSIYANGAFAAANNEAGVNVTQNTNIVLSFNQANAAFVRANNSLNANIGGIIDGDVIITGNLIVQGTEFITQTDSLAIHDNMIYLNNPIAANVANAVGNGTHVIYTTDIDHGYDVGMGITVSGVTPNSFNISGSSNTLIGAVTTNTFTVVSSVTDTYVSGGIARARTSLNPDLGFAGGYYTTSYAHAGLFRDASDGIWKFFHNYTPEPDTSPYINTNDPSFRIADLTANIITDVISVRGIDPLEQANGAFAAANNEAGVNATQNTNIQYAWNHANAAYEQANVGGGGGTVTVSTFNATANGAQTTFEIGFSPVSADAVQVTIDGLVQPETSYTADANANTITFLTAPTNGEQVRVLSFYTGASAYIINDGSITPIKLSAETNNYINTIATNAAIVEASAVAVALAIALG